MPETGASARPAPSLQHLGLIWFVLVMGLSGLALAWAQASAVLGDTAGGVARVLGGLAAALFAVLLLLLAWRLLRWPNSLRLEWMHPVRYVFAATVPVSLILLATVAVALGFLGWALTQLPRCFDQPFGMPMWSLSFPMAAFASLTLRLAAAGALPGWVGQIALALTSVVIAALLRWTWWGLRSGDLLQPEPGPAPKP